MKTFECIEGGVTAARGFRACGVAAGIKYPNRKDVALVVADAPAAVAALYTTNKVEAAPVQIDRDMFKKPWWGFEPNAKIKKEAGHYSGLPMRTKRLNQRFVVAPPRTLCWLRRRRPRLTTHTEHCVSACQRWD